MPDNPVEAAAETSEKDRMARLLAGDENAFRAWVMELSPALLRFARLYTPSPEVAEEAVQETWLTIVTALPKFRGDSSLRTWAFGICLNIARKRGVKERRSLPFSALRRDEQAPPVDPDRFFPPGHPAAGTWASPPFRWDTLPADRLEAKEVRHVLDRAIAALPLRQRQVVTARDVLGCTAAEVQEMFQLSAGNERILLHRARSRLRAALEAYFAEVEGGGRG